MTRYGVSVYQQAESSLDEAALVSILLKRLPACGGLAAAIRQTQVALTHQTDDLLAKMNLVVERIEASHRETLAAIAGMEASIIAGMEARMLAAKAKKAKKRRRR